MCGQGEAREERYKHRTYADGLNMWESLVLSLQVARGAVCRRGWRLERRSCVRRVSCGLLQGLCVPEFVEDYPEVLRQQHYEFARAGSDVTEAYQVRNKLTFFRNYIPIFPNFFSSAALTGRG